MKTWKIDVLFGDYGCFIFQDAETLPQAFTQLLEKIGIENAVRIEITEVKNNE